MTVATQNISTTEVLPNSQSTSVDLKAFREAVAITNRHMARDNILAALAIFNNYVVFAACVIVCEHAESHFPSNRRLWWAIYISAVLVIASRLRACDHLVHEASHNTLFTNALLHEYFEFLYAFPAFRLTKVFRAEHLEHHKYLGDPVRDPDVPRYIYYGFTSSERMSARRYWWLIFGLPLTGWFHYMSLITLFSEFWTSPVAYPSKFIYWGTVLSTVHLYGKWTGFALYYLVPVFGILPIIRWWAELGEHIGLDMTGKFGNSRTNDGFWQRWWLYPLNDGLHAAHHVNSRVPFHRLRHAHEDLMKQSVEYRTKNIFSNGILETFRQMHSAPTVIREVSGERAKWNNGQVGKL